MLNVLDTGEPVIINHDKTEAVNAIVNEVLNMFPAERYVYAPPTGQTVHRMRCVDADNLREALFNLIGRGQLTGLVRVDEIMLGSTYDLEDGADVGSVEVARWVVFE